LKGIIWSETLRALTTVMDSVDTDIITVINRHQTKKRIIVSVDVSDAHANQVQPKLVAGLKERLGSAFNGMVS